MYSTQIYLNGPHSTLVCCLFDLVTDRCCEGDGTLCDHAPRILSPSRVLGLFLRVLASHATWLVRFSTRGVVAKISSFVWRKSSMLCPFIFAVRGPLRVGIFKFGVHCWIYQFKLRIIMVWYLTRGYSLRQLNFNLVIYFDVVGILWFTWDFVI